jgi:EAL domain-containing protein (putative c-di-GMP-specific phosphodiesterase class I)
MRDMPHDVNGTALVKSILAMAGQLGLRVVAEGIETREQAQFLASHGKPCMQGFLFCRPMPLGELISQLEAAA